MKIQQKHIIFDLGGVLINIEPQETIEAFQKEGTSLTLDHPAFKQIETHEISSEEFIQTLQKHTPSLNKNQVIKTWNILLKDIPKKRIELLKRLKKTHTIYLLSNTNEIHINEINNYLYQEYDIPNIQSLFHQSFLSYEIGMRKPNSNIYQYVLDKIGIKPQECIFIDDTLENIEAANKLDIPTIHLQKEDITTYF